MSSTNRNAMARLIDRRRAKVPVTSMGFSMQDRIELLKLSQASEDALARKLHHRLAFARVLRDGILVHVVHHIRLPALAQRR